MDRFSTAQPARWIEIAEDRPGVAGLGAAAQRALRAPQPGYRLCALAALRQWRAETVDGGGGWRAARRRERLWIWRHKFPCRARGVYSAPVDRQWQAGQWGRPPGLRGSSRTRS